MQEFSSSFCEHTMGRHCNTISSQRGSLIRLLSTESGREHQHRFEFRTRLQALDLKMPTGPPIPLLPTILKIFSPWRQTGWAEYFAGRVSIGEK